MRPLEIAETYLARFCAGDVDGLAELITEDFEFIGPFVQSDGAGPYLEALRADPPVGCSAEILHAFEDGDRVNLIYRFSRAGVSATMSQLFEIRGEAVSRSLLIFDPADLN
jgi:SnoaL-like protein